MKRMAQTMPIPDCSSSHPSWCDRRLCHTYDATSAIEGFVLHATVLHEQNGRLVELLQRDTLDGSTARVEREPARALVTCDCHEELNLSVEEADAIGAALSHAAALCEKTS
jgi:hypothetical protein